MARFRVRPRTGYFCILWVIEERRWWWRVAFEMIGGGGPVRFKAEHSEARSVPMPMRPNGSPEKLINEALMAYRSDADLLAKAA